MNYAYLFKGRCNEHDIDTRTAHVRRTQCDVYEYLATVGPRPDRFGPTEKGRVRRLGVRHLRRLGAPAKHVGRAY